MPTPARRHLDRPDRRPPARLRALALLAAWLLGLVWSAAPAAAAQSLTKLLTGDKQEAPAEAPTESPDPVAAARVRLEEVSAELEAARARVESAGGELATVLADEVAILERIESYLRQQVTTAEQIEAEQLAQADIEQQIERARANGFALEPPFGFLQLEALRDAARDARQRADRLRETVAVASEARARAKETAETRDRERRQTREAADSQTTPSSEALKLARRTELESRAARQQYLLRQLELQRDQTALVAQDRRATLAELERDHVAEQAELRPEDREEILTGLKVRESRRRSEEELARVSLDRATELWLEARQRLEDAGGNDPVLQAEVEYRHVEQRRRKADLDRIAKRLNYLDQLRDVWEQRFQVFEDSVDATTLRAWETSSQTHLETLSSEAHLAENLMSDARRNVVTLDSRIEAAPPEIAGHLRRRRGAEQQLVSIYEDQLTAIEELRRLRQKLLEDVRQNQTGAEVMAFLGAAWDKVTGFWSKEIYRIEDNSITVGKIVWGLLILLFGGFAAKRISRFLGAHVLPTFRMNEGALHAFEVLSFYLLVITFALLALRMVNIPLTAFTILGGALAIGVGFGSQNVVNNFISGLILLTEQPVRVADLIQIGELYGTVQHIGLRSTRLRTGENVEIIVPNSSFLEQNVINWTLTDTKTRIKVEVGVAYGSPTRKVKDILKLAASEHGRVLKNPEPLVVFNNFGDNALEFELHFWIHMKKLMDRKLLESDIRFRIDSLCREADITIAYPQRDLHLNTLTPLEVRLVPPEEDDDEDDEAPPPKSIP